MNLKFESMGKIKDFPASDIVGKFIVFKNELQSTLNDVWNITFGYVFPLKEEGLLVAKIATGSLDENNYVVMNEIRENDSYRMLPQKNSLYTLNFSEISNCDFIFTDKLNDELKEKYYGALPFIRDRIIESICRDKVLDSYREKNNPLVLNIDGRRFRLENAGSYGFVGKFLDTDRRALIDVGDGGIEVVENSNETVLEILSRLKTSPSYNRKYLKREFQKNRDDDEVCSAILDKYAKQLEGFDREIFESRALKYRNKVIDCCDGLIEMSKSGNPETALEGIDEFISGYSCSEDYITDYIEKDIFRDNFNEDCYIARQDLCNLYRARGVILNDNGRGDEALDAFKKAYCMNPVNVENLMELAVYYLDTDLEKCMNTLKLAFRYVYRMENLRELHFILEECYTKTGDLERARATEEILNGDAEMARELGIPVDFHNGILTLILKKIEYHVYESNKESALYYLDLLSDMRKCKVENMSESFEKYVELEYIDF